MDHTAYEFDLRTGREAAIDETVSVILGAGFTLGLLWAMAILEHVHGPAPADEVQDMRAYAIPFDAPPPQEEVRQPAEAPEVALPLSGIELGASESPVSIAVVPQDLEFLLPTVSSAPRMAVPFSLAHTELKPRTTTDLEIGRIFQEAEVDQKPRAIVRVVPPLPGSVIGDASMLRVVLLLLIDPKGRVETVRVVESSGNARVDEIVARTVKDEWLFSPAVRRGKKVRVLAQQAFRINISGGGSPFSVD